MSALGQKRTFSDTLSNVRYWGQSRHRHPGEGVAPPTEEEKLKHGRGRPKGSTKKKAAEEAETAAEPPEPATEGEGQSEASEPPHGEEATEAEPGGAEQPQEGAMDDTWCQFE